MGVAQDKLVDFTGRDPRFKDRLRVRAARLYASGKTVREIADMLNVSPGRAHILAVEGGAKARKRGPRTSTSA